MAEFIKLGKINTQPMEIEFGKLKTDEIIITYERIQHIKERHPENFMYCIGSCSYDYTVLYTDCFCIREERSLYRKG